MLSKPILTETQLDEAIAERRERRSEQAKREALRELGEVPMLLLFFAVSIATGAFSSLWIASQIDLGIATGMHIPPFMYMGRTFLIGFFSSCIAILAFLVCIIILILYDAAKKAAKKDKRRGHARTRRY